MRFAIEQIAICPADPAAAISLLRQLGAADWVNDLVVAMGTVLGEKGCTNVADLSFNYQIGREDGKPLEFEVLAYRAGANWMEGRQGVSHLGMHCDSVELERVRRIMQRNNIPVVQEVDTQVHTNPAIATTRRYKYVIFGTRPVLGVDLKFIVRRDLP